jgi:arginase
MSNDDGGRALSLIGVPLDAGAGRGGCGMGPAAYRVAGIAETLGALGHDVEDLGDLDAEALDDLKLDGRTGRSGIVAAWTRVIEAASHDILARERVPVFLGGDHALSMGSVSGAARLAEARGRKLFVLWLDSHADFNTPATSPSGNMHGMPVAFFCGAKGMEGILPAGRTLVPAGQVYQFGIRSIDPDERLALVAAGVNVMDMRRVDEFGAAALMREILDAVAAADGMLHVSLDVDFLDPDIAPGVGTTVPGGATLREAHLVMEMLSDSGLVTSLDLAELNPFLDDRGKSARIMVELTASLFGRRVFDRPTLPK